MIQCRKFQTYFIYSFAQIVSKIHEIFKNEWYEIEYTFWTFLLSFSVFSPFFRFCYVNGMIIYYSREKKENENFQNLNLIAYTWFLETSRTFEQYLRRRKKSMFGNSNIELYAFVESTNAYYFLLYLLLLKEAEIIKLDMKYSHWLTVIRIIDLLSIKLIDIATT